MGKGVVSFLHPKVSKVPVDKKNNTFQNLHGVTTEILLAFPVMVCLVDKDTRATRRLPLKPLKNSPRAPTIVQEGSLGYTPPGLYWECTFTCFFKKQKQHALQIMECLVQFSPRSNSRLQKGKTIICPANAGLGTRPSARHTLQAQEPTGVRRSKRWSHSHGQSSPASRGRQGHC